MNDASAATAAMSSDDTRPAGLQVAAQSEAGAMLRRARKAQGLHIAALAASIKVPQAKLDLLEGRTYPFTRPVLRNRPLSRLAEPVLVAGIITGLVFLFYSSQN